jgi:hypothetical protein
MDAIDGSGPIARRLQDLHRDVNGCLNLSSTEHARELGLILQIESDIGLWQRRASRHATSILLENARRELSFAIYSASGSLYLQAFANLRLFLELSFASVYFSVREIEWRRWLSDRLDFSWSAALDSDTGVLSSEFVKDFFPQAAKEAPNFGSDAKTVYRNCSQFIHGKTVATGRLPRTVTYRSDILSDWCRNAESAATCVLYLLYCRYADELLPDDDGQLADTLDHSFSHLSSVRTTLREANGRYGG